MFLIENAVKFVIRCCSFIKDKNVFFHTFSESKSFFFQFGEPETGDCEGCSK